MTSTAGIGPSRASTEETVVESTTEPSQAGEVQPDIQPSNDDPFESFEDELPHAGAYTFQEGCVETSADGEEIDELYVESVEVFAVGFVPVGGRIFAVEGWSQEGGRGTVGVDLRT